MIGIAGCLSKRSQGGYQGKLHFGMNFMAKDPEHNDIFLNDELLIELAMRELKGRRPPEVKESTRLSLWPSGRKTKLLREIEGRGWTPRDLAEKIGIPAAEANALVRGGQRVTPELARKFGVVFATSSEYWLTDDE